MNPSMRLKVKTDTFYLPDQEGGVYFRNNIGSFRMTGTGIEQWIEKLLPVFNGDHSMESLTDGLPEPYRRRVYEIAESLYNNGFVRDTAQDHPHELSEEIVRKFSSQIEFLDSFGGSGGYRMQTYRDTKVLAIGCGPMFVSLVASLLESGIPKVHMRITGTMPTHRERIDELAAYARESDPDVQLTDVHHNADHPLSWREIVRPFDAVLYVSMSGELSELKNVHAACREERKLFLPACLVRQVGMAGPFVHPDSDSCWESAWRRVHEAAVNKDPEVHTFSDTAGALLSNIIVFETFKTITGVTASELKNKCFLLDLETLEGSWHPFFPHPLVKGHPAVKQIKLSDLQLDENADSEQPKNLIPYFLRLTSSVSGIFHQWEEGDLIQLPLSQCRVQPADPLSDGPAQIMDEIICPGLTHEEARKNSGLRGVEAYVSRLVESLPPSTWERRNFLGIGAGETAAEGICRALQKCLGEKLHNSQSGSTPEVSRLPITAVDDERCRFYLRALSTMQGETVIAAGEETAGFPVMWIGTNHAWYGCAGLNRTLALRAALEQALLSAQNGTECLSSDALRIFSVNLVTNVELSVVIPPYKEPEYVKLLRSALRILQKNRIQIQVYDLTLEPFMKEELAGVFGVSLEEEGSI